MIISGLYFGDREITRIYCNGVAIWQSGERLSIIGFAESKTYAVGDARSIILLPSFGCAESDTEPVGLLKPLDAVFLDGRIKSVTDLKCNLLVRRIARLDATLKEVTYTEGFANALRAVFGESVISHIIYTEGSAGAYDSIFTRSYNEIVENVEGSAGAFDVILTSSVIVSGTNVEGTAYSCYFIPTKLEPICIQSYTSGDGCSVPIIQLTENIENVSDAKGECRLPLSFVVVGEPNSINYINGVGKSVDTAAEIGVVDSKSSAKADAALPNIEKLNAISNNKSLAYAKMSTWELPYINNRGSLYIRQVYDATVTDDVLEVK